MTLVLNFLKRIWEDKRSYFLVPVFNKLIQQSCELNR